MERQTTRKEERQRKFLLVLPVLVVPFITLMFWALGGGSDNGAMAQSVKKRGINTQLPDARFDGEKPQDKMGYYDHADADSVRMKEQWRQDPSFRDMSFPGVDSGTYEHGDTVYYTPSPNTYNGMQTFRQDSKELQVYRKLEDLNTALKEEQPNDELYEPQQQQVSIDGIDRLQEMMETMSRKGDDPEMKQIDGMLERILDIQHPERVKERLRKTSEQKKGQAFGVSTTKERNTISILQPDAQPSPNAQQGFYSWNDLNAGNLQQNIIEAVVHETQTVTNGSTVKLRLTDDVFINGTMIPKDRFVYGVASLNEERLEIHISGIHYNKNLFPVTLTVYDLDGLAGIYIPGAIARDVAKQSTDRTIQNIGLSSIDASWQAQAAGAGVEAAKSLFSKKVKLIKVTLKAGYKVLLFDEKQKEGNN